MKKAMKKAMKNTCQRSARPSEDNWIVQLFKKLTVLLNRQWIITN
jgi:hypothetical protein